MNKLINLIFKISADPCSPVLGGAAPRTTAGAQQNCHLVLAYWRRLKNCAWWSSRRKFLLQALSADATSRHPGLRSPNHGSEGAPCSMPHEHQEEMCRNLSDGVFECKWACHVPMGITPAKVIETCEELCESPKDAGKFYSVWPVRLLLGWIVPSCPCTEEACQLKLVMTRWCTLVPSVPWKVRIFSFNQIT